MNAKYVDSGKQAVVTAETAIKGGDIVAVKEGKIYGVAHLDIPTGQCGIVDLTGKYEIMTDGSAFAMGDTVYLSSTGTATASTTGTYAIGIAAEDVATTGTSGMVYFNGFANVSNA